MNTQNTMCQCNSIWGKKYFQLIHKHTHQTVLTTECDHVGAKVKYFPDKDRFVLVVI